MAQAPVPTPTNNEVPSTDIRDAVFAGAKMDEVMTSENETFTDRKGVVRKTWAGFEADLDSIMASLDGDALIKIDKPTGIAETTDGQYFRVAQGVKSDLSFIIYRNDGGIAVPVAYQVGAELIYRTIDDINSRIVKVPNTPAGAPERWVAGVWFEGGYFAPFMRADGRLIYVDKDGVEQAVASDADVITNAKRIDETIDDMNERVIKVPNTPAGVPDEWVAGVWFEGGYFAPYMRADGRLIFVDKDGNEQTAASDSDVVYRPLVTGQRFELPDGAICVRCNVDAGMYIHEAWSEDGGYYVATAGGLKRVGAQAETASRVAYASAVADVMGMSSTRVAVNTDPAICYIIVGTGQSLEQGWSDQTNDTLIATSQLYPSSCFMFKSTRGTGKENPNRDLTATPVTQLEPLKETINGGWKETAHSSLASHLVYEVEKHTGHRIRTLSFIAANGGKSYMDLTKGTNVWDTLVQGLIDARDICAANGWKPVVLGLDVMGGETDNSVPYMTRERYARQLMQLDRNFNAEVHRIFPGQAEDALISVCQSAYTRNVTNPAWNQPVRQAQYDCDGVGNIRLAGPVYPFPSGDVIHINSLGQNRRGQMVSRVFLWEKFATGWRTIKCTGYSWLTATKLRLNFDTPRELVLDTSGAVITVSGLGAGLGFICDDGTESPPVITEAVVSTTTTVDLTLSKAFANSSGRIGYATKRNDGNTTQDGPVIGARGCLRDSTAHPSLYESGVTHANWCPSFVIDIK